MNNVLSPQVIHYEPLPKPANDAALAGMQQCGFSSNAIVPEYSISSLNRKNQSVTIKINAVAFTHTTNHISEHAGITLFNAANGLRNEELVPILAKSTAPFHLIHRDEQFFFYTSLVNGKDFEPKLIQSNISYERLSSMLSDYSVDLKPERISNVKQGKDAFSTPTFRNIKPLQLSLLAADVTRSLLVNYFGRAVEMLRSSIGIENGEQNIEREEEITDLAIQLLGAIILADTGVLGDEIRRDGEQVPLRDLMEIAYKGFDRYFKPNIINKHFRHAQDAYELLRGIRYAAFTPDMLRDLYVKAYSEEERQKSGSYDTPLYLTRQIWKNIPVEYLPPEKRVVADITCGWGSFLIAGHERLSSLSDMRDFPLREFIRGNDKYPLTAKLAGLGLLLSTSKDRWNIDHQDALQWNWLNTHQPNIIVGNPPFAGNRKVTADEKNLSAINAKRQQEADKFLGHAIERLAPNGYLAMVLPRSFTAGEASPTLRETLLRECDVLELWQLPSGIFKSVNPHAIVLFAQKKPSNSISHYPVRVRTIQKTTRKEFQDAGTFTVSGVVVDQSTWNKTVHKSEGTKNTHIMEYKLVLPEQTWQSIISQSEQLDKYAHIFRGATVGNKGKATGDIGKKSASRKLKEYDHPEYVFWLRQAMNVLSRQFYINYKGAEKILYPNDLQWPRLEEKQIFESLKVLVAYAPDPSWGRRAKAAIDRRGYYVSDSFWVVKLLPEIEKLQITHEVIAAVLNWDVCNAWFIEHMTSRAIPEYAINTLPFPKNLKENDCNILTEAVKQIEKVFSENEGSSGYKDAINAVEARDAIDTILKAAYNLDEPTFRRLREIAEWDSSPLISLDTQSEYGVANCFVSGIIKDINAQNNTVTLWIKGFEDLQQVQIVPSMPGWMLRPGAEFYTKVPRNAVRQGHIDFDNVDWDVFYPQTYTYLSEVELMQDFARLLQ